MILVVVNRTEKSELTMTLVIVNRTEKSELTMTLVIVNRTEKSELTMTLVIVNRTEKSELTMTLVIVNRTEKSELTMTLVIVNRTEKSEVRALWQSSIPVSPFRRRRFILTYQLVSSSTNFTSRGTTVYRRYAGVQQSKHISILAAFSTYSPAQGLFSTSISVSKMIYTVSIGTLNSSIP